MLARLRDPSDRLLAALLLAPAFALLALIVVYPIGKLIFNSFFDLRLQGGGNAPFVGLENYVLVLQDKDFWNATWNTVLITLLTVPGALMPTPQVAVASAQTRRARRPMPPRSMPKMRSTLRRPVAGRAA